MWSLLLVDILLFFHTGNTSITGHI
jgi:hypothetical protein